MSGKNNPQIKKKVLNENDKRSIKTKKRLREAFFKLLEENDVSQITVSKIVREADVNRSTFYAHYKDVDDMLEKIENEFIEVFTKKVISTSKKFDNIDDYTAYLEVYLNFCKNNYAFCQYIILKKFVIQTKDGVVNKFLSLLKAEIEDVIPNSAKLYDLNDPRHYLTTYAISGILNTILQWMDDGMKTDCSKMAEFLAKTYVMGANTIKPISIISSK